MDIFHTIIKPLVTEKTSHQSHLHTPERGGAYTFQVHPEAKKTQIKDAVEKIYGVHVLSVRTSIRRAKPRRYRQRMGQTQAVKKAVVVLHPDSHIDLF